MNFPATLEVLNDWDCRCTRRLNAGIGIGPVRVVFRAVSRLGNGVFWYALMAALAAGGGRIGAYTTLQMAIAGSIGLALYKLLKARTSRPRPYQVLAGIRAGTDPLDACSFPSGHTLHAVGFTLVCIAHFPLLAWVLVPFTLLVALSRVILGLHYPSDVLAGAAIGASVGAFALLV